MHAFVRAVGMRYRSLHAACMCGMRCRDPRATLNSIYSPSGVQALLRMARSHGIPLLFVTNNVCNELVKYEDAADVVQVRMGGILVCDPGRIVPLRLYGGGAEGGRAAGATSGGVVLPALRLACKLGTSFSDAPRSAPVVHGRRACAQPRPVPEAQAELATLCSLSQLVSTVSCRRDYDARTPRLLAYMPQPCTACLRACPPAQKLSLHGTGLLEELANVWYSMPHLKGGRLIDLPLPNRLCMPSPHDAGRKVSVINQHCACVDPWTH